MISPWPFCSNNQTAQGFKMPVLQGQTYRASDSKQASCHGRPLSECAFRVEMMTALIEPLALTSSQKFAAPTVTTGPLIVTAATCPVLDVPAASGFPLISSPGFSYGRVWNGLNFLLRKKSRGVQFFLSCRIGFSTGPERK